MAAFDTAFQKLYEWIGKTPKLGKMLGLDGFKASSFNENFAARKKQGAEGMGVVDDMMKYGTGMEIAGFKKLAGSVKDALKNAGGPQQTALENFFSGLTKRAPKLSPESGSKGGPVDEDLMNQEKHYKPEFTSLEKMGFVMGGANNPMLDYAKRTASAAERSLAFLGQIARGSTGDGPPDHAI
jgi:hypothetical protein